MYSPDVWDRNLNSLIRSGAFNEKKTIEPMSAFKWAKLIDYFEDESIIDVFADGAETHYYDEEFNLPDALRGRVTQLLKSNPPLSISERYSIGGTQMNNGKINDRLSNILKQEYTNNDMSWETLLLLSVMVSTAHALIEGRHSLRGLIDMGCMIRNEGNQIDFARLRTYLKQLEMSRIAKLLGRLLTSTLGFSKDEVPFAGKSRPSDNSLFYQMVVHPARPNKSMFWLSPREVYATLRVGKVDKEEDESYKQ